MADVLGPRHDIVVVGASAGGVEALQHLFRALPADVDAAIFVVLHIPPSGNCASGRPAARAARRRSRSRSCSPSGWARTRSASA